MRPNNILSTDSYKASHFLQYPGEVTNVSSYVEARRGGEYDRVLFFGLQGFLKEKLSQRVTEADVAEAKALFTAHGLPFNEAGWARIVEKHDGYLPVLIEAVKEGTEVHCGNVLVQVHNLDPELPWVTSYLETSILRAVWYPTTVATQSRSIKRLIKSFLEKTGDPSLLPFKLHDFGARGVSSSESAGVGGAAHLVNFMGTDTVEGMLWAMRNYAADFPPGFSIPAAEHSTICSWGQDREYEAYKNMLDRFAGEGKLVAVVSDSYDVYQACRNIWGKRLKEDVERQGGVVVIRPDSGDPVKTTLSVINILGERFGNSDNEKGYAVLPPFVRIIQGDGITEDTIRDILTAYEKEGWSADNIAFGMGGKLLQGVNRDTCRFAMKASAVSVDRGQTWKRVQKNPATDPSKASKGGVLALIEDDGHLQTVTREHCDFLKARNYLEPVWERGVLYRNQAFSDVRKLADSTL